MAFPGVFGSSIDYYDPNLGNWLEIIWLGIEWRILPYMLHLFCRWMHANPTCCNCKTPYSGSRQSAPYWNMVSIYRNGYHGHQFKYYSINKWAACQNILWPRRKHLQAGEKCGIAPHCARASRLLPRPVFVSRASQFRHPCRVARRPLRAGLRCKIRA